MSANQLPLRFHLRESGAACLIRAMRAADLGGVSALEQQAHSHPWSRAQFENCLATGNLALVVVPDDASARILGYALASSGGGEADIINVAVAADYRRQGIAATLLECLLNQLSSRVDTVFLEVRESNAAAIGLYESFNFNQVGLRPAYYPAKNGREDALIFARVL